MQGFFLGLAGDGGASTAVVDGLKGAASDVSGMVLAIVPIALGVVATIWGIKKAIGFFKASAK